MTQQHDPQEHDENNVSSQVTEIQTQSVDVSRETSSLPKRCPKCRVRAKSDDPHKAYCDRCYKAARENWERACPAASESRKRKLTRAKSGMYKRRGVLQQQPCISCGSADSVMHHHDYSKPLDVTWLCRPCHAKEHEKDATPKPVGPVQGVRRYVKGGSVLCSSCGLKRHSPGQRYCKPCKAEYMRAWRKRADADVL